MCCGKTYRKTVRRSKYGCLAATLWYHFPYDSPFPQMGVVTAPPNTCIANYGQTASVSGMVTIDTYRNLPTPYPTVPSPTPYAHLFSHNGGPDAQNWHGKYLDGVAGSLRYITTNVISKKLRSHLLACGSTVGSP